MKKIILLLAFVFSSQLSASHLLGGEITWKCQSNGKYQFTLVLYGDCGGVTLGTNSQTIATNAGVSISAAYVGTIDIVPSSYTGTGTCAGASGGTGYMQKAIYQSGDIALIGVPPVNGWVFSWNSCCRPSSITNTNTSGYLLRSVMYPFTPPGASGPISAGTAANPSCFDNSPNFLESPSVVACQGTDITYNSYGFDPDFDSIYFSFASPTGGSGYPGTPVTWNNGYTTSSPMPSGTASTAANLSSMGELTFNSNLTGSYALCTRVQEFRSGQLIGEVFRDLPMVVISCTQPTGLCSATSGTTKPSLDITPLNASSSLIPIPNVNGDTTSYIININVGDTVQLSLSSLDSDINPNCASQLITFRASGTDSTQITSFNPGGILSNTDTNLIGFNWVTDSADYNVGSGYSNIVPYDYYFTFNDDQSPINRINIKRVRINLFYPAVWISPKYCLSLGDTIQLGFPTGTYTSYLWSTGDTINSINVYQTGSYSVIVQSASGQTDTLSTIVTASPTPLIPSPAKICPGQTATLTVQNIYASYLWGGGQVLSFSNSITTTKGTFWLTVSDSLGCLGSDTISIEEIIPYTDTPQVCIVTNDTSGYNQIIWERPSKLGTVSYNIYRAGVIGYTNIGSTGVNQLSEFIDNSVNPGLQPHKYYVTLIDSCGNEYGSSTTEHSTVHLQSGLGTVGEVNLIWTSYSGTTPLYYKIYRKAASNAAFLVLDSVNVMTNTYTDFNPPTGYTKYQIAAVMGSGCNSSSKTGVTSSLSNSTAQNTISIKEDGIGSIAISPNPNTGYFSITVDQQQVGSVYRIIDNLGRLIDKGVITEQNQAFDLSDKPKGVYRIQVSNENMAKTLSVVIQ